jgi:hypothetical protein
MQKSELFWCWSVIAPMIVRSSLPNTDVQNFATIFCKIVYGTGKVGDTYYVENDTSDENNANFTFSLPCYSVLVRRLLICPLSTVQLRFGTLLTVPSSSLNIIIIIIMHHHYHNHDRRPSS